jgi:TRAP-type C4-dicarboxylate transport system permease small subunit
MPQIVRQFASERQTNYLCGMQSKMQVVEETLSWLSSAVLFGMMALTSADVFMRYVVARPIPGAFEVGEILMAVLIFTALPLVSFRDEHVTVDFAGKLIPLHILPWMDALVHLFMAGLMLAAGWLLWERAPRVAQYGDVTTVLRIPIWPILYAMGALLGVTALVHIVKAFLRVRAR